MISQIGISYPQSPMSRTLAGVSKHAPQAGERFPWLHLRLEANGPVEDLFERLDDTRFNLLVIGQPAPSVESIGLGELVCVCAVPSDPDNAKALARLSIGGRAFYLLRPDGHVGLAGVDLDLAAVKRWFSDNHVRFDSASPRGVSAPADVEIPVG